MKTKKRLVSVIVTSCVALCLCLALLAGSTYAWFTDTVVSSGNIITAGKIDIDGEVYYPSDEGTEVTLSNGQTIYPIITHVENYVGNETSTPDNATDLGSGYYGYGSETLKFDLTESGDLSETGAIVGGGGELFVEPGQSYARLIKLENSGTIDAAVKFRFTVAGELGKFMWFDLMPVTVTTSGGNTTYAADSKYSFSPRGIDEFNAYEGDGYTLRAGTQEEPANEVWMVLLFGVLTNADNSVQDTSIDLMMTIIATQTVGHGEGDDDYTGPVADYPEWDGETYDISWYNENNSEFTLYTPQQFAGLAHIVNNAPDDYSRTNRISFKDQKVILGADIDLGGHNWKPIGHAQGATGEDGVTEYFDGDFDGNGYTIYNLYIEPDTENENTEQLGLFGHVFGGEFRNIHIHNATVIGTKNIGAIAGTAQSGNSSGGVYGDHCIIENCTVDGFVDIEGTYQVGGLVGDLTQTTFRNCSIDGIPGSKVQAWDGENSTDTKVYSAGGLVGCACGDSVNNTADTIVNTGDWTWSGLSVSGLEISAPARVGGLAGKYFDECGHLTMENCSVTDCVLSITPNGSENNSGAKTPTIGAFMGVYVTGIHILDGDRVENVQINYTNDKYIGDAEEGTYLLFGDAEPVGTITPSWAGGEIDTTYFAFVEFVEYDEGCNYSVETKGLAGKQISR